jgi:tetratricopeptide (TPR) repeat protein
MMNNFTRQLRDVLSDDNFDAVFSILKKFLESVQPNDALVNDLALIKGNHMTAEKSFYNNEISRENYILETSKVRRAVTMILDEIDDLDFDAAKAEGIIQDVLHENPTVLPSKSVKNGQKYALYATLISIPIALISYFAFFKTPEKTTIVESQKVAQKVEEKKKIKPSDFAFYTEEAARIRKTVGQDNDMTEDGKARIRRCKNFLDSALMARPDDDVAYNARADCYMILGKLDSAMTDVETCLSYDSYNTYGYATRAQIKALNGDKEGFYKDIEEALVRGHDVWKMRYSLGAREYADEQRFVLLLKRHKQYKE